MSHDLLVVASAKRDIAEGRTYYENFGKADQFLGAIDLAFEHIGHRPLMFPVAYENVRRALLRKFPFSVFFVVEGHRAIVLAVHHMRRDPAKRPLPP